MIAPSSSESRRPEYGELAWPRQLAAGCRSVRRCPGAAPLERVAGAERGRVLGHRDRLGIGDRVLNTGNCIAVRSRTSRQRVDQPRQCRRVLGTTFAIRDQLVKESGVAVDGARRDHDAVLQVRSAVTCSIQLSQGYSSTVTAGADVRASFE